MFRLVVIVLISAIIIVYLKSVNSELSVLATIAAGVIVLFSVVDYLSSTFTVINELIKLTKIDREIYLIIFKITAIGYLVEFAADTVQDFGLKSLADKLTLAGKIVIFSISIPIIYSIINLLIGLLQ